MKTLKDLVLQPHIYACKKHGLSNHPEHYAIAQINEMSSYELLEAISNVLEGFMTEPEGQVQLVEALESLLGYTEQLELVVYSPDDVMEHPDVSKARAALAAHGIK